MPSARRLNERALKRAELIDVHPQRHKMPLAGVPFAVKNLFDVAGLPTLAGSKIERDARAGAARRRAGAAPGGARRGAGRRAAHGRIRLRLHHGEHALRADAQPARPDAHQRRLQRRLGRGGGGRPGAAEPGLRHQRLDPRAVVAVRRVRPETHLRPAAARGQLPLRRQPRPPGPLRAQRCRTWRWPTTRCRARTAAQRRPGLRAAAGAADAAAAGPGRAGPAHRRARRLVPRDGAARGHRRGGRGGRRRWAPRGWSSCPRSSARAPRPS